MCNIETSWEFLRDPESPARVKEGGVGDDSLRKRSE